MAENATMSPKHITLNALYSLLLNLSVSDTMTVIMPMKGMMVEYAILEAQINVGIIKFVACVQAVHAI